MKLETRWKSARSRDGSPATALLHKFTSSWRPHWHNYVERSKMRKWVNSKHFAARTVNKGFHVGDKPNKEDGDFGGRDGYKYLNSQPIPPPTAVASFSLYDKVIRSARKLLMTWPRPVHSYTLCADFFWLPSVLDERACTTASFRTDCCSCRSSYHLTIFFTVQRKCFLAPLTQVPSRLLQAHISQVL